MQMTRNLWGRYKGIWRTRESTLTKVAMITTPHDPKNIKNSKIIIYPSSELYSLVQKLAFCVFYYLNSYQWDILCHMPDLL